LFTGVEWTHVTVTVKTTVPVGATDIAEHWLSVDAVRTILVYYPVGRIRFIIVRYVYVYSRLFL